MFNSKAEKIKPVYPLRITLPPHEKVLFSYQHDDKTLTPLITKVESPYTIYNLIPDRFIESGKPIEEILSTITALKQSPLQIQEKRLKINQFQPIYYEIFYKNRQIYFNYAIPEQYEKIITNKINSIFKTATLKKIDDYFNLFQDKYYCEYKQTEHFMYSLNTDYRENGFIEALLSMTQNLQDNDELLLQIGVIPCSPEWKTEWQTAYDKVKQGKTLSINHSLPLVLADKLFSMADGTMHIVDMLMNEKTTSKDKKEIDLDVRLKERKYRRMNTQKVNYNGYQVQIKLFSTSYERSYYYGKLFNTIFNLLDAEQEIKFVKCKPNNNKERKFEFQINKNIFSTKELSIFMQMPNRRMQIEYRMNMKSIENRETSLPTILNKGYIPIGVNTYKGEKQTAYFPSDKNVITLPKIVMGSMGSGKTEFTKNFAIKASKHGDSIIYFDFVKNCEASEEIAKHINCIKFDLSQDIHKFALAYPEIEPDENKPWARLKTANILSRQTEFLINSLTVEPLTARMSRYLDSACKIVYVHKGSKINDVLDVLTNHIKRQEFIEKSLQTGCFTESDSEILDLISLNEKDKKGNVTGTNDGKIEGILDRINVILKDLYLRTMMKAELNYEINFRKFMDEGKSIIIQLPEHTFTNKTIKDTIITYFMSRIWLSALQRNNDSKVCHIITDEIHQAPTCCNLLSSIIVEGRKFGIDFYFTTHYLKQFKTLLDAIKSAGTSYMLLAGTEKENFTLLKEELMPYDIEDGLELEPFTSLNLINCKNKYVRFISKLPSPIK